jgi:hypothetical protein
MSAWSTRKGLSEDEASVDPTRPRGTRTQVYLYPEDMVVLEKFRKDNNLPNLSAAIRGVIREHTRNLCEEETR